MIPCCVAAMLNVGEFEKLASAPSPMNAFAKPKSSTLTLPSGHLDVGGFDPVNDTFLMCGFESLRNL